MTLIDKKCEKDLETLKNIIKEKAKYPSYTADLWKSKAKQYYISIALHYIDDDWELHSPLICCSHINDSHDKETIGKLIAEKLKLFISKDTKIHSGVTDGGELASVKFTAEEIEKSNQYCREVPSQFTTLLAQFSNS